MTRNVPVRGQYAPLFSELFAGVPDFEGWVEASSTTNGLTGYFLTQAAGGGADLEGAEAVAPGSDFVFPLLNGSDTELALVNPGTQSASLMATL